MSFLKHATRPFTASCKHRVEIGESYQVTYNPHRRTKCKRCAKLEAVLPAK